MPLPYKVTVVRDYILCASYFVKDEQRKVSLYVAYNNDRTLRLSTCHIPPSLLPFPSLLHIILLGSFHFLEGTVSIKYRLAMMPWCHDVLSFIRFNYYRNFTYKLCMMNESVQNKCSLKQIKNKNMTSKTHEWWMISSNLPFSLWFTTNGYDGRWFPMVLLVIVNSPWI